MGSTLATRAEALNASFAISSASTAPARKSSARTLKAVTSTLAVAMNFWSVATQECASGSCAPPQPKAVSARTSAAAVRPNLRNSHRMISAGASLRNHPFVDT